MSLLNRFMKKSDFESQEDFYKNFELIIPDHFNFAFDVLDEYGKNEPDRTALVWCDDNGAEATFTFGDMMRLTNRAANVYRAHGIQKGDKVMLILKGRHEFWPCLLALHKIGAIGVPTTHMVTPHDLTYRYERAGIKMVVTVDEESVRTVVDRACDEYGETVKVKMTLGAAPDGWFSIDAEMQAASDEFERPTGAAAPTNDDTLLIYFSSGTTGYPKMVVHDYIYPIAHILTAKYWQNVSDGGLHYTVADTGWAKAVWGKLYGQWICGSAVFVYDYDRFNAANTLNMCTKYGVTTFCAPPTVYRFLIKEDLKQYNFGTLSYAVVAGEPLNPEVYDRFLAATGLQLHECYGQTEMVAAVINNPWMTPKPGSMGKPIPPYTMRLMRRDGTFAEIGEEGEIVLDVANGRPPGLFRGYYRDDEQNAKVIRDGWYHTGDVAWMDEDAYFWYVGRDDDLIKSSGYRIGPFEVESALIQHPAVLECAVTGVPDPDRGSVVKATIVLAKGFTASDDLMKEIQAHVRNVTAPYKYPRIVEFVDALPKTISGKIRRVEIRERDNA